MAIVNQYFSNISSSRYVFKTGKVATFVNGLFRTSVASEIEELNAEIAEGNQHIYIKAGAEQVDTANDDPLIGLKRKIIDDYIASQKAAMAQATDPNRDMGSTTVAPQPAEQIKPVSTVKIAQAVGKSNSK